MDGWDLQGAPWGLRVGIWITWGSEGAEGLKVISKDGVEWGEWVGERVGMDRWGWRVGGGRGEGTWRRPGDLGKSQRLGDREARRRQGGGRGPEVG